MNRLSAPGTKHQKWLRLALCLLAGLLAVGFFSAGGFAARAAGPGSSTATGSSTAGDDAVGEITTGISLEHSGGLGTGVLLDRNRSTSITPAGGDTIGITSETPFTRIYLVWDRPPAAWELEAGGATSRGGSYGYLHELATLETPVTEATLTLGEGENILCDIYLFGDAPLPDWVQQWQPPCEKADLVVFSTHADDEHLFFGGILPTYAGEQGLAVQVVYMTNHWGERYRPHELLDGLWTVGVTAYPVIGPFPDLYASLESLASAESVFDRDEVLAFQVEMLRRFKPLVAAGHDLNGEYGHGAHILNAQTLVEALELTADETAYPESAAQYGTWDVPKTYLHLYPENEIIMDWTVPLERFGGATAFEMAEAGFAKHTSQVTYFSVQLGGTWEDCRKFGLVRSTVGPDVAGNDLFENIDMTPEPEPAPEPESVPVTSIIPAEGDSLPGEHSAFISLPASTQQPSDSGSSWVIMVAVAAVVVIVVLVAVLVRVNRGGKKGGKGRRRW